MHRRSCGIAGVFALLLAMLLMACNPNAENATGTASLTVTVSDETAKLITPDADNVDISHYKVIITNPVGAYYDSGYLDKGESFTVSGLVSGEWDVKAEAYVNTAGTDVESAMVKVATTETAKVTMAGENQEIELVFDKLDETKAGTVTVTLLLPSGIADGSFSYWYAVTDISGSPVDLENTGSEIASLTGTAASGQAQLSINGLNQGSYLLYVSVMDGDTPVTAVDAMRLIASTDAVGTLDFAGSSEATSVSVGLTVEDLIGDILEFSLKDGTEFNFTDDTFSLGFPEAYSYKWYVDGIDWNSKVAEKEVSGDSGTASNDQAYTLSGLSSLGIGRHVLTVVAYLPDMQISVGSIDIILNKVNIGVEIPSAEVTVSYYDLAKHLELGDNEINMGFTKDGGGVEFPYRGEWNDLNGDGEVTYDELGLEAVSGELDEYFSWFPDLMPGRVFPKISSFENPMENLRMFAFEDYPSPYITFPASVTEFFNFSILVDPYSPDSDQMNGAGYSTYQTGDFAIKEIVFNESFSFNPDLGFPFIGLGYGYKYENEEVYLTKENGVTVYMLGEDTNGAFNALSSSLDYGPYNIESLYLSDSDSENGVVELSDGSRFLINHDLVSIEDTDGELSMGDIHAKVLDIADINEDSAFYKSLISQAEAYVCAEEGISYSEAIVFFSSSSPVIFNYDFPDGVIVETVEEPYMFGCDYNYDLWKEWFPNLKRIGPDYVSCTERADSKKGSIVYTGTYNPDEIICHIENLDFQNIETIPDNFLKATNENPSFSGISVDNISLYGGTQIGSGAFHGIQCKELNIYGDIVFTPGEAGSSDYGIDGIFGNSIPVRNTAGGWDFEMTPTDVIFHEGVTVIPAYLFDCGVSFSPTTPEHIPYIRNLVLPSSLRTIEYGALYRMEFASPHLIFPGGLTTIGGGNQDFGDVTGRDLVIDDGRDTLSTIYIPDSVLYVKNYTIGDPDAIYVEFEENEIPEGWEPYWHTQNRTNIESMCPVYYGYTLEEYAAAVGITIPEGFTGGTLPVNV